MKKIVLHIVVPAIAFALTARWVTEHGPTAVSVEGANVGEASGEMGEDHALEALRWYNDQRAYPSGTIPRNWKEKALARLSARNLGKSTSTTALTWTTLGSGSFAGRTRSVVVDPNNTSVMYCGSVSGGVWKTTNGGSQWFPTTDGVTNLAVNCLVMDPANSSVLYAGTGEGSLPIDALRGAGILKTTDGGTSWTVLANFSNPDPNYSYFFINKIVVSTANSNVLWAGLIGGVWKSTNAGTSWTKLSVPVTNSIACMDLAANPLNPNTLYAAFGLHSADGIYKTINGGTTWSKLTSGFPALSTQFHRISLAVGKSDTNFVFACLADSNDYTHSIQRSTNGGGSWAAVATPYDNSSLVHGTHLGGQGWYDNVIAVNPKNVGTVFTGGINVFKSIDTGRTWTEVSDGYAGGIHVDEHAITFDPTDTTKMYFGNDGGVFKSTNAGSTFSTLNNGLVTLQFYSLAVHPSLDICYGGTQDNGTLKFDGSTWSQTIGGDGGPSFVDPATPATVYGSYVYLEMFKTTNSGSGWSTVMSGIPTSASGGTSDRCSFIAPFTMDPSNSHVLVGGTFKVYRTTNQGGSWSAISSDLTGDGDGTGQVGQPGSTITAISVAKGGSKTIYVGTSGSGTVTAKVQVTTNGGTTWTDVTKAPLPDLQVTSFAINPADSSSAYAAFSGYGSDHIFFTTNSGGSWTDAAGDLPDIPVNTIIIDPVNSNHLVAGTDIGVFESTNAGVNWTEQNSGLANVAVDQLFLRSDAILFAGTHGRGMYKTTGPLGIRQQPSPVPSTYALGQNYPNPFNPSTTIPFTIARRSYVRLQVYDAAGREVATLVDKTIPSGSYQPQFRETNLASGVYFYVLHARDAASGAGSEYVESKKMVLLK